MKHVAHDVDAYIAEAPEEVRTKLVQLREIIRATAPHAKESINYGMPYYKYHGALVGFAAFKHHIGLYASLPDSAELLEELKEYDTDRGTIRFPIGQPLPVALIEKLVKARVQKNESKSAS